MERPKDYYGMLGVPRDASLNAITRAYRRLARRLEPKAPPDASHEELQALQRAYETLKDADSRRRYDESLLNQERASLSRSEPFPLRLAAALRRPMRPETLAADVVLSAAEAKAGGVLPVDLPVSSECRTCEGTGGGAFDCFACYGEGRLRMRLPVPVRIPAGVRPGSVFEVRADEDSVRALLLTIHVRH